MRRDSWYLNYKGYTIRANLFGYFEIYHLDRFIKFDSIEACHEFIDEITGEENET